MLGFLPPWHSLSPAFQPRLYHCMVRWLQWKLSTSVFTLLTMAPTRIYLEEGNTVKASLNFHLDPALGGHTSYHSATVEKYRRKFDVHEVEIHDARGREDKFSLETHGFQYHRHISVEKDFLDDRRVKAVVYPETEELIKEMSVSWSLFRHPFQI